MFDEEKSHPTVQYGSGCDSPVYYRTCHECVRFVKADEKSTIPEYLEGNATCAKHGRVKMPFAWWAEEMEG